MKTQIKHYISLFIGIIFFSTNTLGQSPDSIKQKHPGFNSRKLNLDNNKTAEVVAVTTKYKKDVQSVMSDKSLSDKIKRIKIDDLIATKNKQLSLVLTPAQLDKIIPTTERQKPVRIQNADSLKKKNRATGIVKSLPVNKTPISENTENSPNQQSAFDDIEKYKETKAVQDSFRVKLKALLINTKMSKQEKSTQMAILIQERNKSMMKAFATRLGAENRNSKTLVSP